MNLTSVNDRWCEMRTFGSRDTVSHNRKRRFTAGSADTIETALLANHIGVIDTLVDWYEQEWAPYYGARRPDDARADLMSRCNRGEPPSD